MKKAILILSLILLSFSSESSTGIANVALERANNMDTYDILHYTGTEGEYVLLNLPVSAIINGHGRHADDIICIPPCRP